MRPRLTGTGGKATRREADAAQRLMETSKARGQEEEEDRGEEVADGHESTVRSLEQLTGEENGGGEMSRGKRSCGGAVGH